MKTLPLSLTHGHLFVELDGGLWLFDTGAPTSFGTTASLNFAASQFSLQREYMGLNATTLSEYIGMECSGLLGADILGRFDHLIDTAKGSLTVSDSELSHDGHAVHVDEFMGIPIVTAFVAGTGYRMFFDTGAQVSYFQDESLAGYEPAGSMTDFYPGVGQFQTDTHDVPFSIGEISTVLRCGSLPSLLGATLMMAGTHGIIGNQILEGRVVGFFPKRGLFCL